MIDQVIYGYVKPDKQHFAFLALLCKFKVYLVFVNEYYELWILNGVLNTVRVYLLVNSTLGPKLYVVLSLVSNVSQFWQKLREPTGQPHKQQATEFALRSK